MIEDLFAIVYDCEAKLEDRLIALNNLMDIALTKLESE